MGVPVLAQRSLTQVRRHAQRCVAGAHFSDRSLGHGSAAKAGGCGFFRKINGFDLSFRICSLWIRWNRIDRRDQAAVAVRTMMKQRRNDEMWPDRNATRCCADNPHGHPIPRSPLGLSARLRPHRREATAPQTTDPRDDSDLTRQGVPLPCPSRPERGSAAVTVLRSTARRGRDRWFSRTSAGVKGG